MPGIFFGKGFGDLPNTLSWLRPLAITGAVTLEHPMAGMSTNFGIDPQTGQPRDWPLRYSTTPWSVTLKDLAAGAYEFRVRTVDLNGFAQPEPRPR